MRTILAITLLAALMGFSTAIAQPGGMRLNQDNVPGWTLMTVQERTAHREAMQKLKTYDECTTYMAQLREKMEARAKEQGRTLRGPPNFVCDQLRAGGAIQ
jgi:hypothetical protein